MFIGHYAAAISLSSLVPSKKGTLTFISLASVLPDIFMLSAQSFGLNINFHTDAGFFACIVAILGLGYLNRFSRKNIAIAFGALFLHVLCDFPYMAQDKSNFYNYPIADFIVEGTFLVVGSVFYVKRHNLTKLPLLILVSAMLICQVLWNFVFY